MINKLLKDKILKMTKEDQEVRINKNLWKNIKKVDKKKHFGNEKNS